ncbi:amidohydrolase family protein [Bradyrhizobium sp. 2TAF24]|uniref:amidohydrolase family protein n=1 Tax=Bradyrhizobium sp. 2TAF24 TaxID=3233011 RepID=UPI003F922DB8
MQRPLTGRPPKLQYKGLCDTHIHIYDSRYPVLPGTPSPPDASVADYKQLMTWLGIERVVVVQPNAYGDDNRCTMEAVKEIGPAARAVVVVKPGVSDDEMVRLTREGARGIRFMSLLGGTLSWPQMDEMGRRAHEHGWHALVQLNGRDLPQYEAQIRRLPGPFIIDHIGKFIDPVPPDHESFKTLLRLLDTGRCYVKLAAAYEFSKSPAPHFEDVAALAKALIRHAPERMIWASNWPHAQAHVVGYPDDVNNLDLLLDWAPDAAVRERILVTTPAELYGF